MASAESRAAVARAVNLARLESLELQREHDKDVFQSVAGSDGQVSSLTSQGTLPCTKKQFDGTASWTFVPDFPMVAPPPTPANGGPDAATNQDQAIENAAKALEAKKALARKKAKREFAPVSPYSVEGIDTIIWYDAASGIAETSAGKAFRIDTSSPAASTLKGRDFPIVDPLRVDETRAAPFRRRPRRDARPPQPLSAVHPTPEVFPFAIPYSLFPIPCFSFPVLSFSPHLRAIHTLRPRWPYNDN